MGTVKKDKNRHGDTSSDTAVSLKKGDFNTPSVDPIFQQENGGLKYDISKPPLDFSTQNRHRMAVSCVRIYTLNSYLSLE